MIEIDSTRYAKVARNRVLQMLENADLKPDKFTAHRDRSFTAKYLRHRQPLFNTQRYEERMETVGDNSVAIFKRPNSRMDRGRYITLRFAVAALERLGLESLKTPQPTPTPAKLKSPQVPTLPPAVNVSKSTDKPVADIALIHRLLGVSRDMKQLTHYAHDLIEKQEAPHDGDRQHMLVTLGEMKKHVEELAHGLQKLVGHASTA